MRTIWSWFVRGLLAAVCVFLAFRSGHIALADLRAQQNGLDGLEAAIRMEPGDSVLVAREALFRSNNDDLSPVVDQQLRHAADLDPLNADLPMALGLRAEFRGHPAEAEQYLVDAAEIDHTFRPVWTLANFYVRHDQTEKSWPVIRRGLALDPLIFDPKPVFDLCWNESGDSKQILSLIPARGKVPLQYLYYLIATKRTEAALELWPQVVKGADPSDSAFADVGILFPEFLEQANRLPDAIRIWNQLVDLGTIASGRLNPAAGVAVADPEFSFPLIERGFAWHVVHETGVSITKPPSALRFEFDGNEPESSGLLVTVAPLSPGTKYRLVWKADASLLNSPHDAGFVWRIVQQPGDAITVCEPMLKAEDGVCGFTTLPNTTKGRLELFYTRATGTTRIEGTLRVTSVKLEFGS